MFGREHMMRMHCSAVKKSGLSRQVRDVGNPRKWKNWSGARRSKKKPSVVFQKKLRNNNALAT